MKRKIVTQMTDTLLDQLYINQIDNYNNYYPYFLNNPNVKPKEIKNKKKIKKLVSS